MSQARNVARQAQPIRANEGTAIDVQVNTVVGVDGKSITTFSVDATRAPAPDRRYVADCAGVIADSAGVKLLFAQSRLDGGFRSMLVVHMSGQALHRFVKSIDLSVESSLRDQIKAGVIVEESLSVTVDKEPDQTVAFASNIVLMSFSGNECTLDFMQISSFSLRNAHDHRKLAIEPVVRIDLRTGLTAAIISELTSLRSRFVDADPPTEK